MARTGENIYKRKDGRWEARHIHSRRENGKARYKSVYGRTYAEAKRRLAEAVAESAAIRAESEFSDIAFEVSAESWLEHKKTGIKESTYTRYSSTLERHIIPFWRGQNVGGITTSDVDRYIADLLNHGLSPKTTDDILVIVKGIFKYAQKRYSTVCDFSQIDIPKGERRIRILTKKEQNSLEKILLTDTDRSKLGVLLCLFMGIRVGELCALKGENIDLSGRVLYIESTMQRIKNLDGNGGAKTKIIITGPKSKTSLREIPIPKSLLPILRKFKTNPNRYFLTGLADSFVEPRTMQNRFKTYLEKAQVKNANFHATRHTFATNAIEQGFDVKSLSEILGHANVNTTLELYVHPSFELKRKYMDRLGAASPRLSNL